MSDTLLPYEEGAAVGGATAAPAAPAAPQGGGDAGAAKTLPPANLPDGAPRGSQ
jgi:hypothetical protein